MSDDVELELKRRFDAGDLDGTASAAIEAYGSELFAFLVGLARDHAHADDVFAATCERFWKGLPSFRGESTFRVWAYAIARNEFLRATRQTRNARREVPVSQVPAIEQAIHRVRSATPVYQRTDVKDRLAKVREQLAPDDHMLLGLRLDRRMSWTEIARILGSEEAAITKESAALRKRFERLKLRLRELIQDR